MKTNIIIARVSPLIAAALFPLVTSAFTKNLCELVNIVMYYFDVAIYMIIALATVIFIWNVYKYFFKPDAERKEAGLYVMYSVIGFFIILSFWGLVNIVKNTLNLDTNAPSSFGTPSSGSSCSSAPANSGLNLDNRAPITAPSMHL
ncbi:MAG: hypothetical protein JWO73_42 [Candidatus Taylorbacteria bacterium]|nr:hypothetical protein [Candidatus Taylorbacteria bacterium]